MVQLYMYEQDYAYVVGEAIKDIDGPAVRKDSGILNVAQHARVKVVLTSPDVDILDGENEQVWFGKYLAFDFAFGLPFDFSKKQILLLQIQKGEAGASPSCAFSPVQSRNSSP